MKKLLLLEFYGVECDRYYSTLIGRTHSIMVCGYSEGDYYRLYSRYGNNYHPLTKEQYFELDKIFKNCYEDKISFDDKEMQIELYVQKILKDEL